MKNNSKISLIRKFLRGSLHCFIITVIASALVTVLDGFVPQILRYSVDCLIGGGEPELPEFILTLINRLGGASYLRSHFYFITIAVAITAALAGIFRYLSRVYSAAGSERFTESARNQLFAKIINLPFSWHTSNKTGEIIQRCTSDVEMVRNFVATQLIEAFRVIFMAIYAIFMMYSMNVTVATAAVAFMPIIFGYSLIFNSKINKRFKEADESEGFLSTVAQENLTGVRVVRAFGREAYERDKFEKANQRFTMLWAKLGRIMSLYWGTSDLAACIQMLTVLIFCVYQAADGNLSAGECIAFISYNVMLSWPIRSLGRMVSEMSKAGVSIDRLNYIMNSEVEDNDGIDSADFNGDIEFDHVSFSYGGDNPELLHDISFKIEGGSTLGIIGGTGSGKSTLVQLLCRMYDLEPNCGQIRIGGTDISKIKRRTLRDNVSIVLQEPFLFSRTIEENIGIAVKDPQIEDIYAGAKAACVHDAIKEFSQGYETIVGERGVTLSGGQKQRVAIARTLLKKSPIVIFDDSLSAVDTETDAKIRSEIAKNKTGTTIIVSHRITSLMSADKIMVLDKGRVAEFGTHDELIALGGIYKQIYEIQQSGAAEAAHEAGLDKSSN